MIIVPMLALYLHLISVVATPMAAIGPVVSVAAPIGVIVGGTAVAIADKSDDDKG